MCQSIFHWTFDVAPRKFVLAARRGFDALSAYRVTADLKNLQPPVGASLTSPAEPVPALRVPADDAHDIALEKALIIVYKCMQTKTSRSSHTGPLVARNQTEERYFVKTKIMVEDCLVHFIDHVVAH